MLTCVLHDWVDAAEDGANFVHVNVLYGGCRKSRTQGDLRDNWLGRW